MKKKGIFGLLFLSLILTACPPSNTWDKERKAIENNNMDFPDLLKETYEGITFNLSSLFEDSYGDNYCLQDYAYTKAIYNLDLYFSVEKFNKREAEVILFAQDQKMENLEAVHRYYIFNREASLDNPFTSEMQELPTKMNLPGYFTVVQGSSYSYGDDNSYFTATVEIDENYYVFQLIGRKESLHYLLDDFFAILRSIH